MKFYKCNLCGNLMAVLEDSGVTPLCCGQAMELLKASTFDTLYEKHLPLITESDGITTVHVGSLPHPMTEEHHIDWILLETDKGFSLKYLKAADDPMAEFSLPLKEHRIAAYDYCNIHGLWMSSGESDS